MAILRTITFAQLKDLAAEKEASIQIIADEAEEYEICINDGSITWKTLVEKGTAEETDLVNNFIIPGLTDKFLTGAINDEKELTTFDSANTGGLDTVLAIAGGATVELKVGASVKANRKYVQIEAEDDKIKYGYSISTQSFNAFKEQTVILPVGSSTSVYIKNNDSSPVNVSIGEF